ncbi:ABC transporter substrate-binding protein [Roseinatronobacter alkalisoli]|uniref:ABC transporter substrate-binding protein n=1 Tax=Roseinatronobacter alkalisoli TaxID=3028235 RepID=A0ABT5TGQ8_9RHOB|nr:ABC transporter substrate-binding protein [Roseinatronobacter sp. HJB301]MDD7973113.1 ABC transporter substrate-binding protein [Roseinatronobacter sp. HJB301]
MFRRQLLAGVVGAFTVLGAFGPLSAWAEGTLVVTDLAGRMVEVPHNPQRVILGEGRLLYATSILDRDDPVARLAGWAEDMIVNDPGTYRAFLAAFPQLADVPRFANAYAADFSAEQAIALEADLIVLPLGGYYRAVDGNLLATLEAAGIPTIFVDLREDLLENTAPSMALLGRIFDREDVAQRFNDFYLYETRAVTMPATRIAPKDRPLVIMERAQGIGTTCCNTYGAGNLGRLVDAAGGQNWGSSRFPGTGGEISLETIIAENPAVIIGTGADWSEARPESTAVRFGYELAADEAQAELAALATRPGWTELQAVASGDFHSVWHQFYTGPLHLVALQLFATWLHPDDPAFAQIDPEATMRTFHDEFLPIPYTGVFWTSLHDAQH